MSEFLMELNRGAKKVHTICSVNVQKKLAEEARSKRTANFSIEHYLTKEYN